MIAVPPFAYEVDAVSWRWNNFVECLRADDAFRTLVVVDGWYLPQAAWSHLGVSDANLGPPARRYAARLAEDAESWQKAPKFDAREPGCVARLAECYAALDIAAPLSRELLFRTWDIAMRGVEGSRSDLARERRLRCMILDTPAIGRTYQRTFFEDFGQKFKIDLSLLLNSDAMLFDFRRWFTEDWCRAFRFLKELSSDEDLERARHRLLKRMQQDVASSTRPEVTSYPARVDGVSVTAQVSNEDVMLKYVHWLQVVRDQFAEAFLAFALSQLHRQSEQEMAALTDSAQLQRQSEPEMAALTEKLGKAFSIVRDGTTDALMLEGPRFRRDTPFPFDLSAIFHAVGDQRSPWIFLQRGDILHGHKPYWLISLSWQPWALRLYVDHVIDRYEAAQRQLCASRGHDAGQRTDEGEVLSAIASMASSLQSLHCFPDGNSRVLHGVLLNKELIRHGLQPMCQLWNPNEHDLYDPELLREEISAAQQRLRETRLLHGSLPPEELEEVD